MDQGSSNLNPSSLIDLKAELHKKYESFRKDKLRDNADISKHTSFKCKGDQIKEKKEKPPLLKQTSQNIEEENALKKSRLALEAKAKLYEKIVTNQIIPVDEVNATYLVDFHKKVREPLIASTHPDPDLQSSRTKEPVTVLLDESTEKTKLFNYGNYFVKQNIVQEVSERSTYNPDQPLHYQNERFNEVRDHGTGYYAFSTDEAKRKEQMDELNSLHQETENRISSKQRLLKKRKAMIQNRLAKICERKNIDPSALKAFEEEETVEEIPEMPTDSTPESNEEPPKKEPKIRPWDIGKNSLLQDFVPEKKRMKTQNDWEEEKREERPSEFAPPSFYGR